LRCDNFYLGDPDNLAFPFIKPSPMFIIFALYVSLRYTMQREQAFDMGLSVLLSCILAAAGAGLLKFFLLPSQESYAVFTLMLGAFLVPGGALAAFPGALGTIALFYCLFYWT
jgi:hypothetical protein